GVVYRPGVRVVGEAGRAVEAGGQAVVLAEVVPDGPGRGALFGVTTPAKHHEGVRVAPVGGGHSFLVAGEGWSEGQLVGGGVGLQPGQKGCPPVVVGWLEGKNEPTCG